MYYDSVLVVLVTKVFTYYAMTCYCLLNFLICLCTHWDINTHNSTIILLIQSSWTQHITGAPSICYWKTQYQPSSYSEYSQRWLCTSVWYTNYCSLFSMMAQAVFLWVLWGQAKQQWDLTTLMPMNILWSMYTLCHIYIYTSNFSCISNSTVLKS